MGATVQLNVRMDASTKAAGDAALAQIGYAPVDFVRAVWERLAKQGDGLSTAHALLGKTGNVTSDLKASTTPMEGMRRMSQAVSMEMRRMGCTLDPEVSLSTHQQVEQDRELLWQCMQERLDYHAEGDFA